jgi:hypothetical protein
MQVMLLLGGTVNRNPQRMQHDELHLTRPNPASPHLFNPAGSAHMCIQISHTYYSSTDDRETWRCNEKLSKNDGTIFIFDIIVRFCCFFNVQAIFKCPAVSKCS